MLAAASTSLPRTAPAASSSNVVVQATILSATYLDASGCATGSAGVTSLGTVLPPASVRSTADCRVVFGSSNDSSALRIQQVDATGAAFNASGAWTLGGTPVSDNLGSLDVVSATRAWASGGNGVVLTSTNNGASWTTQATGTFQFLEDIDGWNDTTAWVVGSTGVIYATTDGSTWTAQASGTSVQLTSVEPLSASTVVTVGAGGAILRTTNGGSTWAAMTSGTATGLVDVTAPTPNDLWAVGYSGVITHSSDAGATWATQASGVPQHLYGVAGSDASHLWAVGQAGRILVTSNGGATWTPQTSGVATDLNDIFVQDSLNAWATGASGVLLRTTDGGATWSSVATGTALTLSGISFGADGIGMISAFSGKVVRSGLNTVPDYNAGSANWAGAGTGSFGACLASLANGAVAGGGTWLADNHATAGDCQLDDLEPWTSVPSATETVATAATPGSTYEARLRFGFRAGATQAAGAYSAPVRFQVVAPM